LPDLSGSPTTYLSLQRPVVIRDDTNQCGALEDIWFDVNGDKKRDSGEKLVVAQNQPLPKTCIPVTMLPSGYTMLTNIDAPGVPALGVNPKTGPLILRYPYVDPNGDDQYQPQKGYIVEKCEGTKPNGEAYTYKPCFVANLTHIVNAPDPGNDTDGDDIVSLPQQTINVISYGPVSFEQNGRLVISLVNANRYVIDSTATVHLGAISLPPMDAPSVTNPGELHFQL